jgi:hypothetical protein
MVAIAGENNAPGQAAIVEQTIAHAPRIVRDGVLCLRQDSHGATVYARTDEATRRVSKFLRARHVIAMTVKRNILEYNEKLVRVQTEVERLKPPRGVVVTHEIYAGKALCPVVHVVLPGHGAIPPATASWVRLVVRIYGHGTVVARRALRERLLQAR